MKFRLTGTFGELSEVRDGVHTGIDIAMPDGTTLRTVSEGVVEAIRDYGAKNIGKGVIIRANDGNHHIYGHMSEVSVRKGQTLNAGDIIGASGNTGNSTGPHLHFGVQTPTGEFIDPTQYAEPLVEFASIGSSGNWFLDNVNNFADWAVGKQVELILNPIGALFKDIGVSLWNWFILNLPDIMGYATVGAGALIILSAMTGKGGIVRTTAWYFGLLIIAISILGGV